MGKPFKIKNVCYDCNQNLSKCGLAFFVLTIYSNKFHDTKLAKKLDSYSRLSKKYRSEAIDAICNYKKSDIKNIFLYAKQQKRKYRRNAVLNLSKQDVIRCAEEVFNTL